MPSPKLAAILTFVIAISSPFPALAQSAPGLRLALTDTKGNSDLRTALRPALYAAPGDSLSPFIAPGAVTAVFTGILTLENRERVHFSFHGAGEVTLLIDGAEALKAADTDLSSHESERLRLNPGAHPIEIHYKSPETGASLRLMWRGSTFPTEPIPPISFSHEPTPDLAKAAQLDTGRTLFGQHRCIRCHTAPVGENAMPELSADAPSFAGIGSRLQNAWLQAWILDPGKVRPGTRMPHFAKVGEKEAADLAAALTAMTAAPPAAAAPAANAARTGGGLFHQFGCANCHTLPSAAETNTDRIPLNLAAAKFAPGALVAFLKAPHQNYQWARMPNFSFSDAEANALAAFISESASGKVPAGAPGNAAAGNVLLAALSCTACHGGTDIVPAAAPPLEKLVHLDAGCLAASPAPQSPAFTLTDEERTAFQAFLADKPAASASLGRTAPAMFAGRRIAELNCNACHTIAQDNAKWGTDNDKTLPLFAASGLTEAHLDQSRPDLTYVGSKLNSDHITRLLQGKVSRARPWLDARMPAFPAAADLLARGLAAAEGLPPAAADTAPPAADQVAIGSKLAGMNGGFACTICHAVSDQKAKAAFEVEGINFALIHDRLRHDYYQLWMHNPPRIVPSSKMPRYGQDDGTTAFTAVLNGNAEAQFEAIWQYLRTGRDIKPPQ